MSLIQLPQSLRNIAKERLTQSYCAIEKRPEDSVHITSLGFSLNPSAWRISSKTRSKDQRINITAILHPKWACPLPFSNAEERFILSYLDDCRPTHIILGRQPLTPPPGFDKAELYGLSEETPANQLRLRTLWIFKLTAGEQHHFVGKYTTPASERRRAVNLAAAAEEFRTVIARKVIARLLPPANAGNTFKSQIQPRFNPATRNRYTHIKIT